MSEFPVATSPAPGVMGVDWEVRVDFERLRQYRIGRVRQMLEQFDLGAVLLFETSNIRYATATQIGYWAFNKGERYALVTRRGVRVSGTSVRRPRLIACNSRTCTTPRTRSAETLVSKVPSIPKPACTGEAEGLDVRDGQQVMLDAREIKNIDEILLLSQAARWSTASTTTSTRR
jgi:Xaa-Pro aminopeptidase